MIRYDESGAIDQNALAWRDDGSLDAPDCDMICEALDHANECLAIAREQHEMVCSALYAANAALRESRERERRLREALQAMVDSYEHEAAMDNPSLLQARAALAASREGKE